MIDKSSGPLVAAYEHAVEGVMAAWDVSSAHIVSQERGERFAAEARERFEAAARKRLENTFTIVGCRFVAAEEQP